MKRILLALMILSIAPSSSVFAQTTALPLKITSGRFFMRRGFYDTYNANIKGDNFSLISTMYYQGYPFNVCSTATYPLFCRIGSTFSVPTVPGIGIGDRADDGSFPQFASGAITLHGYASAVSFFGYFNFSTATFTVPHLLRRRGSMTFIRPFTMSGHVYACAQVSSPGICTGHKMLFEGFVTGHGTLTFKANIRAEYEISPYPVLQGESIEYKFEP